jgi:hypothetical protein
MAGQPQAYDRALSLRLDALISALEQSPPLPLSLWLRVQKRWNERRVPAFGKEAR